MIATNGSIVKELMEWMYNELQTKDCGEVGLRFVLHAGTVVKTEKIDVTGVRMEKIQKEMLDKPLNRV